jgi:hypothetical protein
MARQSPATQRITLAGLNPAMTAPNADGDILPAGQVALRVTNGGGSPITVTAITPGTVVGLAIADATLAVPAGATRDWGPFPASVFAQPADAPVGASRVLVDYSSITSVTRAVVSF